MLTASALISYGVIAAPVAQADTTCPTTTVGSFTAGPSSAPLASCLLSIGNDTNNGLNPPDAGVAVTVSNLSNLGGLADDGTTAYMLNGSTGDVVTTSLTAVPTPSFTSGTDFSATGTDHAVDWSSIGGFPSLGNTRLLSLAYSHGCLFITNSDPSESSSQGQNQTPLPDTDTSAIFSSNIHLYCIDTSTWTVSQVTVPSSCLMPIGHYYTNSSLIEFPDGRIGKVSEYMTNAGEYMSSGVGGYTSVLRTYTVSGTGSTATISCSTDYVMHDTEDFANDEHGIATDGTYLYRIEWWQSESPFYDHNYNSWALSSTSVPDPTYQGFFAMPFSNMHYLTYNPTGDDYLVGSYSGDQFYVTPEADPGPGPGNPLTPIFSNTVTSTTGGYTVQLTNYDSSFTWAGTATNGGSVTVSNTGLVTVTGLSPNASSTVTITSSKTGIAAGMASDSGSANAIVSGGSGTTTTTIISTTTTSVATTPTKIAAAVSQPRATSRTSVPTPTAIPVELSCMNGTTSCSGVVKLSVARRHHSNGRTYYTHLVLAEGSFTIGASSTATVSLEKTELARRLIPEQRSRFRTTMSVYSAAYAASPLRLRT